MKAPRLLMVDVRSTPGMRETKMTPRKIQKAVFNLRRHGLAPALHDLALRTVNSAVPFEILRGVSVERVHPAFLKCPKRYTPMFLPEAMIREFARDPESGMSESFVEEALSKGDECYGICDGAALASYGWYSIKPTRIDPPELLLDFSKEYAYMYKGFTNPRYRGQRLHATGMTLALRHYLSRGLKGLVSYVESNNFDSLKSAFRMGYVVFGSVYVVRIFGRHLNYRSRGCGRFGFRIEQAPPPAYGSGCEAPQAFSVMNR